MVNIQQERIDAHVHSIDIDKELEDALESYNRNTQINDTKNKVGEILN